MATSASALTTVCDFALACEPSLFVKLVSTKLDAPEAMFVNAPPSAAKTVTVRFVTPFTGNEAKFQVTTPPAFAPDAEALTKVKLDASWFDKITLVATDGPR